MGILSIYEFNMGNVGLNMVNFIIIGFIAVSLNVVDVTYAEKTIQFNLTTTNNEIVSVDSLLQKGPVLITFWALWCKNCKEELQAIKKINTEYPFNEIMVVLVNEDSPRSMINVRNYITTNDLPFLSCMDPNQKLLHQFNVWSIPCTILLNGDREIILKQLGYIPGDEKKLQIRIIEYLTKERHDENNENN